MKNPYTILLFDLDRTLYPFECGVWDAIGDRIHSFMETKLGLSSEDAINLRIHLREQYKSSMQGLHEEFNINEEEYLQYVHQIDLASLFPPNPGLPAILAAIPQKKYIFTNSISFHAERVLNYLHISDFFEEIIDARMILPYTKFERESFPIALHLIGDPNPMECVMIDDEEEIIERAKEEGLQGILVNKNPQLNGHNHIQIATINEIAKGLHQLST